MRADDARHGTNAGYVAGCREDCCRVAKVRYDKRRRWELHTTGQYRKVPAFRVIRRIRALQALGWSIPQIARRCDMSYQHLYMLSRHETAYVATLATIVRVYDELSMTLPPETNQGERISVARARNHARRMGWPPPLAWDDIDDPAEQPTGARVTWDESSVDFAVVERVLSGSRRPRKLTNAEAAEVVRRCLSRGMTGGQIETLYGLKVERYWRDGEAVA